MSNTEIKPFTVTTTISSERITDLLCGALEGGSNYWAHFQCSSPEGFYYIDNPEWELTVIDVEENGRKHTINRDSLIKGLSKLQEIVPHQFNNFMNEDDDAETSDCYLQCCVFEDVIYG